MRFCNIFRSIVLLLMSIMLLAGFTVVRQGYDKYREALEGMSLEEKVGAVMEYARLHRSFSFRQLLERQGDKLEVVITFLAVLELMKIGKIHLKQENLFDDMEIETLEEEGEETELELDLEGLEG